MNSGILDKTNVIVRRSDKMLFYVLISLPRGTNLTVWCYMFVFTLFVMDLDGLADALVRSKDLNLYLGILFYYSTQTDLDGKHILYPMYFF